VTRQLEELDVPYIVIDNSNKHVQEALNNGLEAYLGDASKLSILNAIHIEKASSSLYINLVK
jgi:CPA2 family monovalent cation:H+ antiporter-2